jgi:hypothetical protein
MPGRVCQAAASRSSGSPRPPPGRRSSCPGRTPTARSCSPATWPRSTAAPCWSAWTSARSGGPGTPEPSPDRRDSPRSTTPPCAPCGREIADAARGKLAAELSSESRSRRGSAADREKASRAYQALTSPASPNPTGHRPASAQLEKVADLYNRAVGAGADSARRPSIYIHKALTDEGSSISLTAVRGQIHRARVKGLIAPPD